MTELKDRLQAALGAGYHVDRELGGGGMSRVFLVDEVRLGRRVVVKVLPPEMAAGVSVERFEREIQLAAKLQHPHIVPLLTAGSSGDLLYYIMPYIEGESLRAKLAGEGELPVPEALRILRDVVDALSYAHDHHVVHRDIKPDNVLLSGKHALVTDFGVAKAVAESTGRQTLTSMGVALGTPLYMAPEQATADPHTDHRADIYAVGVLAYEMLSGQPPFTGPTAQAVLAAHLADVPEPVTKRRTAVPEALSHVIQRCLEKKAADRWQRADELLAQLDALVTPTGGTTPPATQPVSTVAGPTGPTAGPTPALAPARAAALFVLAAFGVAAVVYALVRLLGLPSWVFVAALGLLAIGLPIIVLTGHHERRRVAARASGVHTLTPPGLRRLFTWRRALAGGGLAFAALGVAAGGFMALRALGIGPFATLLSSGRLRNRATLVVADFANRTSDSTLGRSMAEALRIDLSQSPVVRVMGPDAMGRVLARMERPESTRVTAVVAREIAERGGLPAVVEGEIGSVGAGYVLSARVVAVPGDSELLAVRETAPDEAGILPALARLSAHVRERIGESYRSLRDAAPLQQVTTSSLEALRLFTRGDHAAEAGDAQQAIDLLQRAVAADTGFAMAYRELSVVLSNQFQTSAARTMAAAAAAYRHRDRLPPVERALTEALYYAAVERDPQRLVAAYRAALVIDSTNSIALNDLANEYEAERRWAEAESLYTRALVVSDTTVWQALTNLVTVAYDQGQVERTRRLLSVVYRRFPGLAFGFGIGAALAYAEGNYDSAITIVRALVPRFADAAEPAASIETWALTVQGRLAQAEMVRARRERVDAEAGDTASALRLALGRANAALGVAGLPDSALRLIRGALQRYPLDRLPPQDRPWELLIHLYADAGQPSDARAMLTRWEHDVPLARRRGTDYDASLGRVALAEGRPAEARAHLAQAIAFAGCNACYEDDIGRAWDAEGRPDSALAAYDRFLDEPDLFRLSFDPYVRAAVLRRAAELAEQIGRRDEALKRYGDVVELWQHADPALQPIVADVKQRMARLAGERQ